MRARRLSFNHRGARSGMALLLALLLWAHDGVAWQSGWTAVNHAFAGRDLNAVHFVDGRRGWAAGDGGLVIRTEDGGSVWARQTVPTTDDINDIYFRNREDGYLLAGNRIFGSEDGGTVWRELSRFEPALFGGATPELYSVRFPSRRRGWVVGSVSRRDIIVGSLILYTDDGGRSWVTQSAPTRRELIHLDFVNDRHGWVVGANGTILRTRDGGQTWTAQQTRTTATLYHVNFRNERIGWAVGERGTILRTTDGGDSWLIVPSQLRSTLLSVKFANNDDGWIVGRGGVILRSGDGGRTWVRQESRTNAHLFALHVDRRYGWAVGSGGIVLQYER